MNSSASSSKTSPASSKATSPSPSPVSSTASSVKRFSTASQKSPQTLSNDPPALPPTITSGPYTEFGLDFDFKKRVFDHWDKLFASEGANITPPENFFAVTRYAEIWSEVALRPASLDPLNEQEREAIATGIFYHIARRVGQQIQHRHGQQHQKSSPASGFRTGGGRQRGPTTSTAPSYPNRRMPTSDDKEKEDIEEEPILWASEEVTPTAGSIDEKGVFHVAAPAAAPQNLPPGMNPATSSSLVDEVTMWFYKDPKGNEQGPFNSETMLDWYNRKFFTDALPLRKQNDPIFEPLGYWRAKNNGKIPFDVPPPSQQQPIPPVVSNLATSGSLTSASTISEEPPVVAKKEVPAALAPIGSRRSSTTQEKVKKIDINSLFSSGQKGNSVVSSVSSDSIEKKQPEEFKIGAAARAVSAESISKVEIGNKSTTAVEANVLSGSGSSNGGWNVLNSNPNKAPSLSSIMKEQKTPSPFQSNPQPTPQEHPSLKPSPIVAWKKTDSPTQPLSSIINEQSTIARSEKRPSVEKKGPVTFADLVKSMGSTSLSTVPPKTPEKNLVSKIAPHNPLPVPERSPVKQSTTPSASSSIRDWCIGELSSLNGSLDVPTVVGLLLELKSASEAASFIRDNFGYSKLDLGSFGKEFVKRKFNKDIPSYIFIPQQADASDIPFEQVQRRRK
jgi:hypothetical protein